MQDDNSLKPRQDKSYIKIPKKGQVWINRGFWSVYKTAKFVSYVRVIDINSDHVVVKSIADNKYGDFNPNSGTFMIARAEWDSPKWTIATKEELQGFDINRKAYRILYGDRGSNRAT